MNFIFAPNMVLIPKYIKDKSCACGCGARARRPLQKLSTPTPRTMTQWVMPPLIISLHHPLQPQERPDYCLFYSLHVSCCSLNQCFRRLMAEVVFVGVGGRPEASSSRSWCSAVSIVSSTNRSSLGDLHRRSFLFLQKLMPMLLFVFDFCAATQHKICPPPSLFASSCWTPNRSRPGPSRRRPICQCINSTSSFKS